MHLNSRVLCTLMFVFTLPIQYVPVHAVVVLTSCCCNYVKIQAIRKQAGISPKSGGTSQDAQCTYYGGGDVITCAYSNTLRYSDTRYFLVQNARFPFTSQIRGLSSTTSSKSNCLALYET